MTFVPIGSGKNFIALAAKDAFLGRFILGKADGLGEMEDGTKDRSEDMTRFDRLFATAILSGVLVAGGGMSIAAAHHGEPSDHSTTKGKTLSEIEMRERQITAELNRKQLEGPQVAMVTPASPDGMPAVMPAMPNDEEAALADDGPELAAIEDDAAN